MSRHLFFSIFSSRRGSTIVGNGIWILWYSYLAIALVTLGAQIPIRLASCGGAQSCLISFAKAPIWALIWPAYLHLAFVFAPEIKGAMIVMAGICGGSLLGWKLNKHSQ
jgi:hypothetical protein